MKHNIMNLRTLLGLGVTIKLIALLIALVLNWPQLSQGPEPVVAATQPEKTILRAQVQSQPPAPDQAQPPQETAQAPAQETAETAQEPGQEPQQMAQAQTPAESPAQPGQPGQPAEKPPAAKAIRTSLK